MNDKASVSKELNAKHAKILEGLLKLPENRECADCRGRCVFCNQIVAINGPQGGRASTLGYSSACNVQEFIGVLGYISPSYLSCFLLVIGKVDNFGHMAAGADFFYAISLTTQDIRNTVIILKIFHLPLMFCFMFSCAGVGNEKSNNYWEADLSASVDRSDIGKFIRTKYQDKKWASRYNPQPGLSDMIGETSDFGGKADVPRKARKYSLEEDVFSIQPPQVPTTTRSRGVSLDTMDEFLNLPPKNGLMSAPSVKHKEDTQDLFSLLYAPEGNQDRTIVPPSRWATFE
ncbi:hypothetical protein H5410_017555 [Solanum commersonii]|uniref:Uncharacterized protein n=1 Tax=Solanum commersonii TaxID=4109 RepID=A0A9J6A0B2_SOLCO|nr:hypothetical protein H5410_017555 [Solanum commersonii]